MSEGLGLAMQDINSQVAEQHNSLLDRLRTQVNAVGFVLSIVFVWMFLSSVCVDLQVAYMSHDNAMLMLTFFLGFTNQNALKKLKEQWGQRQQQQQQQQRLQRQQQYQ